MSYCDDCILVDICGCESCYDESLTFCADKHKYIRKSELKDIKKEIENIDLLKDRAFEQSWSDKNFKSPLEIKEEILAILDKHIKENKNE